MQQETQTYTLIKWGVIGIDLVVLNGLVTLFCCFSYSAATDGVPVRWRVVYFVLNIIYLCCISFNEPILQMRKVRPDQIVGKVFSLMVWYTPVSFFAIHFLNPGIFPWKRALLFYLCLFSCITLFRLCSRSCIRWFRKRGRNTRDVLFVGSGPNMADLYDEMMGDPTTGYRVLGYFDARPSEHFKVPVPYLGPVNKVYDFASSAHFHPMGRIYCSLTSEHGKEIREIIHYCENHLIRFYSVPNIRNYLRRPMCMQLVGEVPVLYIREEPLRKPLNRFVKRAFDLTCSLLFLCTLFPFVYLIVGMITKITSPGPIFFKQKRNGLNGKEFYCYKFRSMRVNDDADNLQATKDDPRKTKWGNFLRESSIDELPQFINVLIGNMSIVGPRPHMLKHTKEYSELINKYMVRHFIKPGITGWAQVTGCRGETKELSQMEARIRKDIWYMENWTFWLDVRIMYLTVRNAVKGEDNAY